MTSSDQPSSSQAPDEGVEDQAPPTDVPGEEMQDEGSQEQEQDQGYGTNRRHELSLKERRCIVSGETCPTSQMIRFVIGPEDEIYPDLAEKLPGRGIWVSGQRAMVEQAMKRGLFAKSAKARVQVNANLVELVEQLMQERLSQTLGLAKRAGELITGLERVFEALDKGILDAIIEAQDAGKDGARKLRAKIKASEEDILVLKGLGAEQMGLALGRANVVHAGVVYGSMSGKVLADLARLQAWGASERTPDEG